MVPIIPNIWCTVSTQDPPTGKKAKSGCRELGALFIGGGCQCHIHMQGWTLKPASPRQHLVKEM